MFRNQMLTLSELTCLLLQIKTRIANEKYLRSHPEVEMLLGDFLR